MNTILCLPLAALAAAATPQLPGAPTEAPAPLQLDTDDARFAAFVGDAAARLAALQHDCGAVLAPGAAAAAVDDQTGALLGLLRLGRFAAARALLQFEAEAAGRMAAMALELPLPGAAAAAAAAAAAPPSPRAAALLVVQHYWYLRATGDCGTVRRHWPLLQGWVEAAAAPAGTFADAALGVHAIACFGGLLDQLDRCERPQRWQPGPPAPRPGAAWTQRALVWLQQCEHRHWSEPAGRFDAADAGAALWPGGCGMLLATGDRAYRHARAVLAGLRVDDALPPRTLALVLAALVQFDGAERRPALARLLQLEPRQLAPGDLGFAVDAALFAVTGVRVAAGPGVDEDWLRLRPELPPAGRRLALRGLRHGAFAGDLYVDEDQGRLRCAIAAERAGPAGELLVVLDCRGSECQGRLRAGEVFAPPPSPARPLPPLLRR